MKKTIRFIFIILPAILWPWAVFLAAPLTDDAMIVRVCIADDKPETFISLKSDYKIYATNSSRVLMEGPCLTAKVVATKDGLRVGARQLNIGGIRVKVGKNSKIYVGGKRFRGDIDILRKDNGRLMIINYIALDDYLYGVLYHEVSHRWPMEVLKAQAIAARTFALYQAKQNRLQLYDLRSDIYSQVYGGSGSEKWSTTMAVNSTKGLVLVYKGELLPAYYHATCAGRTEDASNLWKVNIPPLDGVECGFCVESPHYSWTKNMPLWKLEEKLASAGYKMGKIETVAVLSRNESGRVDKLSIKDNAGVSVVLTGKDFRQLLGPNELRSTNFDVSIKWGELILTGRGWGHGVGMCQWGSYGMAKKGIKADEILRRYYPGAEIVSVEKIQGKL
ncbi:MAG: SpoIID/LytB domain-containing protein [Candidatus Omnitrophica bacterium]|nr:SpoIID/LytB domain-containing protein [Candidatus Omnitrophota bacterium]